MKIINKDTKEVLFEGSFTDYRTLVCSFWSLFYYGNLDETQIKKNLSIYIDVLETVAFSEDTKDLHDKLNLKKLNIFGNTKTEFVA